MKKVYIILLVLILLVSCTTQEPTKPEPQQQSTEPKVETPTETTPTQPEEPIEEPQDIIKIPDNIKEILEKGKTSLKSYSYNYKSPESDQPYKIYVKGNKIKIIPPEIVNIGERKFYNNIHIDTEKKTAEAYCVGYSACGVNLGKIKDLNYEETYIETPLDWLEKVTEAEKIDERMVENRNAVFLETNIGKITVESYYGFLYKIEDGKKVWEFKDAAFNSVKDSDVTPS